MIVRISKIWLLCIIFLIPCWASASSPIAGDPSAIAGTSFSFPLQANEQTVNNNFYVAADPTGGVGISKEYALSYLLAGANAFTSLALQTVSINGIPNQTNPLYNQGISLLSVISVPGDYARVLEHPIVVVANQLSNVYLVQSVAGSAQGMELLACFDVRDATGLVTAGVVSLAATTGLPAGAFAAVKKSGGNFGDTGGSGIALLSLNQTKTSESTKGLTFTQGDAQAAPFVLPRAAPLDISSPSVIIQNNLTSMTNNVAMFYDSILQRLYIGLQLQAGVAAGSGGKALVIGKTNASVINGLPYATLSFIPIAPDTVFTVGADNEIIGTGTANEQVSLSQVQTMTTSMGLDYVVVLGGNGAPSATGSTIYALPLVNEYQVGGGIADGSLHGTLASKNAIPQVQYSLTTPPMFIRRVVTTPATTPADIYTTDAIGSNAPAHVGGGPLEAGAVDEFLVSGDTIFAFVSTPATNQLPGIFYSQALFDGTGKIKAWTTWQRVAGTINPAYGGDFGMISGNFTYMTGSSSSTINTVFRTAWGGGNPQGLAPLVNTLAAQLPVANGAIQGLVNLQREDPGLNNISLLIATGLNKIVLAQTGSLVGSTFTPTQGTSFDTQQNFTDGTLSADANAPVIAIEGGQLTTIGPITTAAVASAIGQGYLFVGGFGGVAVLTTPAGNGWDTSIGLGTNLVGLINGMSFKPVGNYTYVRKLIYDSDFLYVLTDTTLDRLDLTTAGFPATTLARITDFPGTNAKSVLLDLVVSGKYASLATTVGLFTVGNGANIQTANAFSDVGWSGVPVAGNSVQPAYPLQLLALSQTGRTQDVARGQGGNIYLLNAYQGKSNAALARFTVQGVDAAPITSDTLQPLPDIAFQGSLAPYINYGDFVNRITTDGAYYLNARPQNLTIPTMLKSGRSRRFFVTMPLNLSAGSMIMNMVRNSATGSWLIAGDSGMQVNE